MALAEATPTSRIDTDSGLAFEKSENNPTDRHTRSRLERRPSACLALTDTPASAPVAGRDNRGRRAGNG